MTQRRKSQSISLLMIVVFSAVFLWALTAVVWPVPVVYADPPVAVDDTATTPEDILVTIDVLNNDTDPDPEDNPLTVATVGTPLNGNASTDGATVSYSPTLNFNGPDVFTYTVRDTGFLTDTAIVTVTVTPVNDPPVANDDAYSVNEGDPLTVAAPAGVLANDPDVDAGDTLTATLVSSPCGALTLYPDGSFTYGHDGERPSDSFVYQVCDTEPAYDTATVTITIELFDPVITAITVTSDTPSYFYDPGLGVTGGEVFFNSLSSEGEGQTIMVTVSWTDANPCSLEGDDAFNDNPPAATSGPPWTVSYSIEENAPSQTSRVFTVTDKAGLTDTAVITFIQDNVDPTVELTDITDPGYDYDPKWGETLDKLDTDGSNWYNTGDFRGGNWTFTSTTSNDGAGRASCVAFWDHSNDTYYDQTTGCTLGGNGSFSGVKDNPDGTVTVAVIITDKVGNAASDTVVFNIDNTEPTVTSPYINDHGSEYLHVDDLTIYYGDDMGSAQTFTVHGHSSDEDGVGLNVTDTVDFSFALGDNPSNLGTPEDWWGEYTAASYNTDEGVITVTVYDLLDNAAYQTFNYIRDTEPPTVVVTCPALTSEPSWSVSWSASSDPQPASGVKHYDVQYKVGSEGPWQGWHTSTLLTQATFGPTSPVRVEDGQTYYFRARATDNVSNQSPYTNGEDKTTYHAVLKKVFLPIITVPDPNWGFETGDFTNWQHGGELAYSVSTSRPRSGNYSALLGSPSYPCIGVPVGEARLSRWVTVPSSVVSPTLSFYYWIVTQDLTDPNFPWLFDLDDIPVPSGDLFEVRINGSRVFTDANFTEREDRDNCSTTSGSGTTTYSSGWKPVVLPLDDHKGKTIKIAFYNYNLPDPYYNTYTYIDDVSVE